MDWCWQRELLSIIVSFLPIKKICLYESWRKLVFPLFFFLSVSWKMITFFYCWVDNWNIFKVNRFGELSSFFPFFLYPFLLSCSPLILMTIYIVGARRLPWAVVTSHNLLWVMTLRMRYLQQLLLTPWHSVTYSFPFLSQKLASFSSGKI